jgi:hypothetical protein
MPEDDRYDASTPYFDAVYGPDPDAVKDAS